MTRIFVQLEFDDPDKAQALKDLFEDAQIIDNTFQLKEKHSRHDVVSMCKNIIDSVNYQQAKERFFQLKSMENTSGGFIKYENAHGFLYLTYEGNLHKYEFRFNEHTLCYTKYFTVNNHVECQFMWYSNSVSE